MSELNERQQLAVALLATGTRNKDVAEQLGIARVTLAAWIGQPAFRHAIDKERAIVIDAVKGRLLDAADKALNTLLAILDDPTAPAPARVSAARTILGRVLDTPLRAPDPIPAPTDDGDETWNLIRQVREQSKLSGKPTIPDRIM